MEPIWIVVADRTHAQILEVYSLLQTPRLVEQLDNPQGRLKVSDMLTDHGERKGPPATVIDTVTLRFAADIAARLDTGRLEHRFTHLVLVSSPHFLGVMRSELSKDTLKCVISSVGKDLLHDPQLHQHAQAIVREALQYTI